MSPESKARAQSQSQGSLKLCTGRGTRAPFLKRLGKKLHEEFDLEDAVVVMVESPCVSNGKHDHFTDVFVVGDPRAEKGIAASNNAQKVCERFGALTLQEIRRGYEEKGTNALCTSDCREGSEATNASRNDQQAPNSDTLTFQGPYSSYVNGVGVPEAIIDMIKPQWSENDVAALTLWALSVRDPSEKQPTQFSSSSIAPSRPV
jgi:hypothetical protein